MKILILTQVPVLFKQNQISKTLVPSFQAQSMWVRELEQLGHQVKLYPYNLPQTTPSIFNTIFNRAPNKIKAKLENIRNKTYKNFPGSKANTNQINQVISKFKPNIVFISGGVSQFDLTSLSKHKKSGTKFILLHGENPLVSATKAEKQAVDLFELVASNDPTHLKTWAKLGSKKNFVPYAAASQKALKKTSLPRIFDVVFVGSLSNSRQEVLLELVRSRISISIFGYGQKLHPELEKHYHGQVWGEQTNQVYKQSKIALNFLPDHMPVGGNMRTFEIPANGALQITTRCPETWFLPGKEIIISQTIEEIKDKINFYLVNNKLREKIALAGQKRTQKDHAYKNRFKQILDQI